MKSMILFACFLSAQAYAGTCRLALPVPLNLDEMGRHDYTSGKVDVLPARFADYPNGRLKIRVAKVIRGDGGGAREVTDLIAAAVSDGQVGTHSFAPDLLALLAARVGETLQRWARRRAERLFVTRERQQRAFVLDSQMDAALRLHEARAFDARRAL